MENIPTKKSNKLINEKSPYLLQHAYNPVNWYPWRDEAFNLAKKENKPIFLSIGYSTCHWCHVMEKESFEDEEVARLMNEDFVSIKVDREERPDIDNVYMSVCQMMTGSGGWPLTVIMLPDKRPFFAGTYFPKHSNYGRIGMIDLIPRIKDAWKTNQNEILNSADNITKLLKKISISTELKEELNENVLTKAYKALESSFDEKEGGFGSVPKFPTPHNLLFLLRYWKRTKEEKALYMTEKTLQAMRMGGIFDQIGFGFHRYSTDSKWLLPHFEKMLYDQAMLIMAYSEAFQATKNKDYENTANETITYVLRDLTSKQGGNGGFFCGEDADSEGEEGKFYLWTEDEVRNVLSKEESDLIIKVFNIEKPGNYIDEAKREKTGANILHIKNEKPVEALRATPLQKLFEAREKRVHPHKDDKVLTSWNGLMIAALSKAAQVFEDKVYVDSAKSAVKFILSNMYKDGKLLHTYRDKKANIFGHLDDYAFLIWGLIELYEATFDLNSLKFALELNEHLVKCFWDKDNGGFYFTADYDEGLIVRKKEIYDGAIPSGNSVSILNMLRIARFTGDNKWENYAKKTIEAFSGEVKEHPQAYTQFLVGLDFLIGPTYEVVIVGNPVSEDTKAMLSALRKEFSPNKIVILHTGNAEISELAKFTKSQTMLNGKATAYVCSNHACKKPTNDVSEMLSQLC